MGARHYSPALSRWLVPDPLGEKYYDVSPYAYCENNLLSFVDPDGKGPETLWDLANVAMDVKRLVKSIRQNDVKGAFIDAGGLILDVAAAGIPFVPGGAGTAIKAARAGDKIIDTAEAIDKAEDVASFSNRFGNVTESVINGSRDVTTTVHGNS